MSIKMQGSVHWKSVPFLAGHPGSRNLSGRIEFSTLWTHSVCNGLQTLKALELLWNKIKMDMLLTKGKICSLEKTDCSFFLLFFSPQIFWTLKKKTVKQLGMQNWQSVFKFITQRDFYSWNLTSQESSSINSNTWMKTVILIDMVYYEKVK